MSRFGFTTSGSYTSQSPNAAADRCLNLYNETNEAPNGKSPMSLYHTPGLSLFSAGTDPSVRGEIQFNGRAFAVGGVNFYEVFSNGSRSARGTVASDGSIVSFAAGPNQILMASAGIMYVFTLSTNILTPVNATTYNGPISQVAYSDGFFIALTANSGEFVVSAPDDATTWTLLDEAIVSVFPTNIVGMIVAYRQPVFFGSQQSQAYYDAGLPITPFAPVPGGFIEQGAASTFAISFMDNSIFWLGQDARGSAIAWRANGYTPSRVSNHATEFAWQGYTTVSDAISYTYQDQGHTFWVIRFPSANKTWVYDAATSLWHERASLNVNTGQLGAHNSQVYMFAFGKHLVGDWATGNIYEMNIKYLTDNGNPIVRRRRAPHISNEQQWIFHNSLQLDVETGLGPQPPLLDGSGNPRDPQVILRWSDDGGHTFNSGQTRGAGQAGNFGKRVIWRRLGRSRDRVYEVEMSDPIPWRLIDSYLIASPGYEPQERLSSQYSKVS